ncbi:MAG TPA: hypothetical protein VFF73_03295 [Planctomycetota bacterium]|nr:hypothetical protein [Planctomycetota bacterium]
MRVMLKVTMPVQAGNRAIVEGRLPKVIEKTMKELKPEAAYFTAEDGERTAFFFFDMKDSSQLPAIAEPFFMELDARVSVVPAMNPEDLKAGLAKVAK